MVSINPPSQRYKCFFQAALVIRVVRDHRGATRWRIRGPVADARPSAPGEARLSARQGLAAPAGPRRRRPEEFCLYPALVGRGAGGLRMAPARDPGWRRRGYG